MDEDSFASNSSQHIGRHSSLVSYCEKPFHGCFSRQGAQGCVITAFNQWLLRDECLQTRVPSPQSVRHWWGQVRHLLQIFTSNCWKDWTAWCAWVGVPNNDLPAPKLADFLFHLFRVGLAWHRIGSCWSSISAFFEAHHHHQALNQLIISKLMHDFYLQCPPAIYGLIHVMPNVYYPYWRVGLQPLLLLILNLLDRWLIYHHFLQWNVLNFLQYW